MKKGRSFDTSQYELYKELFLNCIRKAGWIYREINRIGAKNVVLFSGRANECELARILLTDDEGKLLKKFDYSKYDFTEEIMRKWTNRDLFIHLKDGTRRFIVTNHPQGTPTEIRDEIVRIIKSNDWDNSVQWRMPEISE